MDESKAQNLRVNQSESPQHERGKLRLCKILGDHKFRAECEKRFPCFVELGALRCRYQVDVYATRAERRIIVEVDGYQGHKTTYAYTKDQLRIKRIRERYGQDIEAYRFTLGRLSKWTDKEIAEELRL
jgi:very-short-patch-repair endonuclease